MNEPKPNKHQHPPKSDSQAADGAGTTEEGVPQAHTTPQEKTANDPQHRCETQEQQPYRSRIGEAALAWLQGYWAAPREKSKWTDILMVLLTVGVAVAALWSALVFQGQLSEMRKQSSRNLESFRIDERAWVEFGKIDITTFPPSPPFGTTFKFSIYLRNVGKTVAKGVRTHIDNIFTWNGFGEKRKAVRMFQDQLFKDSKTGKRSIEPNKPAPHVIAPDALSPVPVYSGGQAPKRYKGGFMYTYVLGRIDYTDVFGVNHWKRFCFTVTDDHGSLGYCEYGNEEDDNAEGPN